MSILVERFFKKENVTLHLETLELSQGEKEKILKLVDELVELRFLDKVLGQLAEKDKELFLEQLHGGSSVMIAEFLREKIQDVERLLLEEAKMLEEEVLADIKSLK